MCAKLFIPRNVMRWLQKIDAGPPIFADLVIETPDGIERFDVETPGYLEKAKPLLAQAIRVGLAMRRQKSVAVWLRTDGKSAQYYSKVFGVFAANGSGHRQKRLACVESDGRFAWLHDDGQVEVAKEPLVRW